LQQLEHSLPFFDKVQSTMCNIIQHSGDIQNSFFDIKETKEGLKKAYVVITGDSIGEY